MNKVNPRINQIEELLKEKNTIPVKDLALLLNVSEMTVRRDIASLKDHPSICNIRGLLMYRPARPVAPDPYNISNAKGSNMNEKQLIGMQAAAMIEESDVVILDIGSTTEHVAHAISASLNATVICVSYNILAPLISKNNPNLKIHCPGGFFHPDTQMFESEDSISFLKNIRAKKLFASAAGIHKNLGITCANNYEALTKKALIEASAERILLADSSKFDHVQSTYIAGLDSYHTIITDSRISPDWEEYLREKGIMLIKIQYNQ